MRVASLVEHPNGPPTNAKPQPGQRSEVGPARRPHCLRRGRPRQSHRFPSGRTTADPRANGVIPRRDHRAGLGARGTDNSRDGIGASSGVLHPAVGVARALLHRKTIQAARNRHHGDRMAKIAIEPWWARFYDFALNGCLRSCCYYMGRTVSENVSRGPAPTRTTSNELRCGTTLTTSPPFVIATNNRGDPQPNSPERHHPTWEKPLRHGLREPSSPLLTRRLSILPESITR